MEGYDDSKKDKKKNYFEVEDESKTKHNLKNLDIFPLIIANNPVK